MLGVVLRRHAVLGACFLVQSATPGLEQELGEAGEGLLGNSEVLRSVLAGSGDCIKIIDLQGRLQFMSEGGKRVMEVEDFSKLKGCPWPDFWAGDGHGKAKEARLSPAVVEVLSVLAYNQPATVEQLNELRGAPSGAALATLVRRKLVSVERPAEGRPAGGRCRRDSGKSTRPLRSRARIAAAADRQPRPAASHHSSRAGGSCG